MASPTSKRIVIEPLTRVEGHGKVTILLDDDHHVLSARLHIVEFRGFERFIQGRPFWEVPVLVQRLCGICPVSHHLCAAKAIDGILGIDRLTPTGEKMRRLMHYGQILQSHALHFFYLAAPDLLFGFDAPVGKRNIASHHNFGTTAKRATPPPNVPTGSLRSPPSPRSRAPVSRFAYDDRHAPINVAASLPTLTFGLQLTKLPYLPDAHICIIDNVFGFPT